MSNDNADINENKGKKGGKNLLIVCALISKRKVKSTAF